MWESRHGFPLPRRLESGHRRYDERDVDLVHQVLRRRDGGARLEVAIAGVVLAEAPSAAHPGRRRCSPTMRRRHPAAAAAAAQKSTLLALSWAIEDECCARAERPMIFGAFQKEPYYRAAEERWTELARISRSTMVFAEFGAAPAPVGRTTFVDLPRGRPDATASGRWSATPPTTPRC